MTIITSKAIPYALVCLVLCVARWGQNTVGVCFIWTSIGSWGKVLQRVVRAMTSMRYWKNRIITLLNDSSTASDCQIAILRWFFIRLNQLNSFRHGKGKILLDVFETSSRFKRKIQLRIHRIVNGRIPAFLTLKAFAEEIEIDLRCIRQIFLESLTTSLRDG